MGIERAEELDRIGTIARAFVRAGSPRVIGSLLAVVAAFRAVWGSGSGSGSWSWRDIAVAAVVTGLIGPVEWLLHKGVLHASPESWASRHLGTGEGHREHHLDPGALRWLLLRPGDAAIVATLLAAVVGSTLAGGLAIAGVASPIALATTGVVVALSALLHYEWTHLLIHARYRPTTHRYQRLARNHRLHHYRNEGYWFGVTSLLGDRIAATAPAHRSEIPASETARTLG